VDLWLLPSAAHLRGLALPDFATLCARADPLEAIAPGLDAALAQAFVLQRNLPWAALLAGTDRQSSTPWLAADLIHVRAEVAGARVMALAADQTAFDPDCLTLFEALRPWLADEAIEIGAMHGGRALLRCPENLGDPAVAAPDALLGCDLRDALPADLRWQRRLNEMQIVLAQQSCNEARFARQQPTWNTLWFWAQGSADQCPDLPIKAMATTDPLLLALSKQLGIRNIDFSASSDQPALRDLRDPRRFIQAWQSGLRPKNAILRCADGSAWRVKPLQRWRFWRG